MADHCCNHETNTFAPAAVGLSSGQGSRSPTRLKTLAVPGGVPIFDGVDPRYKRILWTVIAINGAMFLTEMVAGQLAVRRR